MTNKPIFFANQQEFRNWLEENHHIEKEIFVGFHKVNSGKESMTWSESVDQALCLGWIDGVRRSIDSESYQIRFTPRKPQSNWSAVNLRKMAQLTKLDLVKPAGLAIYQSRKPEKCEVYSYENPVGSFSSEYKALIKSNAKAWDYFNSLAPSYKKASISWVMSAKQQSTQLKRLNQFIAHCEAGTNQWKDNKYTKKKQ